MSKRRVIQYVSYIIFIGLIILNKPQIWFVFFLGSTTLSIFFGRFYCGYLCPINTSMEVIVKRLPNKKSRKIPEWIRKPVVRYVILILFVLVFIFMFLSAIRLPILPMLIIVGTVLAIIYSPLMWHRYLCPFGTILYMVRRISSLFFNKYPLIKNKRK